MLKSSGLKINQIISQKQVDSPVIAATHVTLITHKTGALRQAVFKLIASSMREMVGRASSTRGQRLHLARREPRPDGSGGVLPSAVPPATPGSCPVPLEHDWTLS